MDALAGLLDGPRAKGAFLLRMIMEPPWSVRIEDEAPICLMCVTDGEAWIVPDTACPDCGRPVVALFRRWHDEDRARIRQDLAERMRELRWHERHNRKPAGAESRL